MFCQKCGTQNKEVAKFCKNCGHQLLGKKISSPSQRYPRVRKIALLIIAILVVTAGAIYLFAGFPFGQKSEVAYGTKNRTFNTVSGMEWNTGLDLQISIPPTNSNQEVYLTVSKEPPVETEEHDVVNFLSVYDISMSAEDSLEEQPSATLFFTIPDSIDPQSAVVLQKTEDGWVIASNVDGTFGGDVSQDGGFIAVTPNHFSEYAVAEWLYKNVFRHLEKLPDVPPPDPEINIIGLDNDNSYPVAEAEIDSPLPIVIDLPVIGETGMGGMWYRVVVEGESIQYTGPQFLQPGMKSDVKIEFGDIAQNATLCLKTKGTLLRAAWNWASRMGFSGDKVSRFVDFVELTLKSYEKYPEGAWDYKSLIRLAKQFLIELIGEIVGWQVQYFANMVPVSVDIAIYINARLNSMEDRGPDRCEDIIPEAIQNSGPTHSPIQRTPTIPFEPQQTPKGFQIQWSKTFKELGYEEGRSILQASDGVYIVAGIKQPEGTEDTDTLLVWFDDQGNWRSFKSFEFANGIDEEANALTRSHDGSFIVVGTAGDEKGGKDVWLIKVDSEGHRLWERKFGAPGYEEKGKWVSQTTDGGYIIAGNADQGREGPDQPLNIDALLIKTDAEGNEEWSKTFGDMSWDDVFSVHQTSDGGYLMVGRLWPFPRNHDYDAWVIKTDANGNEIWNKTFGTPERSESASAVVETPDGSYVIAGGTEIRVEDNSDYWLIKVDDRGNLVWDKTYGGSEYEACTSIAHIPGSGYLLVGLANSPQEGMLDLWLVQTDSEGNKVWENTFGSPKMDVAASILPTFDKGYVLTGFTESGGDTERDIWIVKLK